MALAAPGFAVEWTGQSLQERESAAQAPMLIALSMLVVFPCWRRFTRAGPSPPRSSAGHPAGLIRAVLAVSLRGMPNDVFFKVGMITVIGLSGQERHPDHRVRQTTARAGHDPDRRRRGGLRGCACAPS